MTRDEQRGGIIRVEKRGGFTVLDNTASLDPRLSFKALGIHTYLMTRVDTWQVYAEQLAKTHTDGVDSVYSGLRELEQHGYLVRRVLRNAQGQIVGRESVVYERPITPGTESGKAVTGKIPDTGKPCHGKSPTNKDLPSVNTDQQQELTLPEWLPEEAWGDFLAHRKALRAPVTALSARRLLKTLETLRAEGHDPVQVIDQSISTGKWTGLFPLKGSAPRRAGRPATQADANEQFIQRVQNTARAIEGVFDE